MNALHLGFKKDIELPKTGFLFIGDELPSISRARIFDPLKHSLNPLKNIDYKKARELSDALYTISPQGENTLTVRNGKRALLKAFLSARRIDKMETKDGEIDGMIGDLLISPVLKRVLCNPTDFSFSASSIILAKISRKDLGDFDALTLGLILINHFKGQIIIPDFGFYGRDAHISLVREERLIAGVNFLAELPIRLRQATLLIKDKVASHALFEDAEVLAGYAGFAPHTNEYNDEIQRMIC